jgi:hypothetical protein
MKNYQHDNKKELMLQCIVLAVGFSEPEPSLRSSIGIMASKTNNEGQLAAG